MLRLRRSGRAGGERQSEAGEADDDQGSFHGTPSDSAQTHQAQREQQYDRAQSGADQIAQEAGSVDDVEVTEQPAADKRADHADDHVANQAEAVALDDNAAEPAGERADQQENEQGFTIHVRSSLVGAPRRGAPPLLS